MANTIAPEKNPIAAMLGVTPGAKPSRLMIGGRAFVLHPATNNIAEGMYRENPGHGVPNPCFSLGSIPADRQVAALGAYLLFRHGENRNRLAIHAVAAVAAARAELACHAEREV